MSWYTNYFGFLREVISAQQAQSESPMGMVLLGMLWHNALLIGISIPVICLALDYGEIVHLNILFPSFLALFFIGAAFIRDMSRGPPLLPLYVLFYLEFLVRLPLGLFDRY